MKKVKIFSAVAITAIVAVSVFVAADHLDAPDVSGSNADIADFYAFEPTLGSDSTTFIVDIQSDVVPAAEANYGEFAEDVLLEINIDLDGDLIEDRVIQAIRKGRFMYFFGPFDVVKTGLSSEINTSAALGAVEISTTSPIVASASGISLFAGPRQDAFFFDFNRFNEVIAPSATDNKGFNVPGIDTFNGANTLSIAIELPNRLIGAISGGDASNNVVGVPVWKTWVTTNRK